MKKQFKNLFNLFLIVFSINLSSQEFDLNSLRNIELDNISNQELRLYILQAEKNGYSIDDLISLSRLNGVSESDIEKFVERVKFLDKKEINNDNFDSVDNKSEVQVYGIKDSKDVTNQRNEIFGFDFFNNPNINFTPNINVATPSSYQLGPGDNIIIDIWGASEKNYSTEVDRYGAIRLEKIGPIYIGGMQIEKAKEKIRTFLKKIYSGIDSNDYDEKVYADVSVSKVRTININLIGEVKVPGTYNLTALSTVINALYSAGGPTQNGSFRNIEVYRNNKLLEVFDLYKYLTEGSQDGNVYLQDDDIIIVKPYHSRVMIEGEVKRPGIYELKKENNLLDLLKYSGGLKAKSFDDIIVIERIDGKSKKLIEVASNNFKSFKLVDGDYIFIDEIVDKINNSYIVQGPVFRPGEYEFKEGIKMSDVFERVLGLRNNASLEEGLIYRTDDDFNFEVKSFSPKKIINKEEDFDLKLNDRIVFYSKDEISKKEFLTVVGAVNSEKVIEYVDNLSVQDLIIIGGGLKYGSDKSRIDIFSRILDQNYETLSIKNSISYDQSSNYYLKPNDVVTVRTLTGYDNLKNIEIKGMVKYPGFYSLENINSSFSEIILKSGGFQENASIENIYVERRIENEIIDEVYEIVSDSVDLDFEEEKKYRIPLYINDKIADDFVFENNDIIYVPQKSTTILVKGDVWNSTIINYDKTLRVNDYISKAGGFKESAKRSKVYVIDLNGNISSTKKFLFFNFRPKISPGSTIIIPEKKVKVKSTSLTEIISISTALGTLGVLLKSM